MKFIPGLTGLVCEGCKKIFTVLRECFVDDKLKNLCEECAKEQEALERLSKDD